jgi:TonB family protein
MWLRSLAILAAFAAQASAEDIRGTLHSPTGAPISDARVMLMSQDYVKLAETKSGQRGEFEFKDLKPAFYLVQAKKTMFQLAQQHIFLNAGKDERIYLVANLGRGLDQFTATIEGAPAATPPHSAAPRGNEKTEPLKLLKGRPPAMPASVRQRGIYGTVALYATVQTDGSVIDIVTLESPDAEMEQVCRAGFQQWRYDPMKLDGVPVKTDTVVIFEFLPSRAKP